MADQNPWASESQSHGSSYQNTTSSQNQNQHSQGQYGGYTQQRFYEAEQQQQVSQQPSHQSSYNAPYTASQTAPQTFYSQPAYEQQPDYNAWSDSAGNPPLPQRYPAHNSTPSQGITRHDTDEVLQSQPDRAEQVEHMQAYEATANESVDDRNRAQLEKEFPDIDGSLIAALYSDSKDLSETRELLQELGRQ